MRKRSNKLSIIAIVLVASITIGYAALSTLNRINSRVGLGTTTFSVHFDNISEASNNATVTTAADYVDSNTKKDISFEVYLNKVGDYYSFNADIVNESTIPAKISSVEVSGLTDAQKRLLKYRIYYNGSSKELTSGDFIGVNASKSITFVMTYELSDDIVEDDLTATSSEINAVLSINYENANIEEYRNSAISTKLMKHTNALSSSALTLSNTTSSVEHEGVYVLDGTQDDDFPIYFYRGGHEAVNNHVLFGGFCWRILRTTNTGGIKMIYNGEPTNGTCISHPSSTDDVHLLGMWFGANSVYSGSSVSNYLDSWFFDNLIAYQDYMEDTPFCNDTTDVTSNTISLECTDSKTVSVHNGKHLYPVGLLTLQEAIMSGAYKHANSSYQWLYTGNQYWTMSQHPNSGSYLWYIDTTGAIGYAAYNANPPYKVRPVISLSPSVELNVGTGKYNVPYIVS